MLLLFPALGLGQAGKDDSAKVSNDRPDRPLQMPAGSTEVKEAFDDFERFQRRGAWERALKALDTIPEEQASRFLDGPDDFIISVARKRREELAGLPPDGQAAYRLFHDSDAKRLLDSAEGPTEQKTLERIVSAYFLTSYGDEAADRLGDLYFEAGRFDRAADCWLAILQERPDSELSPALISVKAILALARAGRWSELEPLRREVADRYAGERIAIGGKKATAAEHLARLLENGGPAPSAASGRIRGSEATESSSARPDLTGTIEASWQVRYAESVTAGMAQQELVQWESHPLSTAVPAVAITGSRLYANYLGYVFAVDLSTGKLLWRSGPFHNAKLSTRQDQSRWIDPRRFAILASESFVWCLVRDLNDANMLAPFRLVCRRADNGDVVWQTSDLPDYAALDLVGTPTLANGTLYVAARTAQNQQQGQPRQSVLAIRARDGKLLWSTEVGAFREGQRYYYYGMIDQSPRPRLVYRGGAVYVDTHVGVLARLDAESGELEWGFAYPTDPVQAGGGRFFFFNGQMMPDRNSSASSEPLFSGSALLLKGQQSNRMVALDPDRMKRLWDRPIARSARLLGSDEQRVYLGGPELGALDRETRVLKWSTRLPGGSFDGRVLVRPEGLWQMTPRGIFEVDPSSGRVRRVFRGEDTGSDGGDLYLTDRLLVAVTNKTISAYPTAAASAGSDTGFGGSPASTSTGESDE
jgi:outer membrane protein assembly factor BamB